MPNGKPVVSVGITKRAADELISAFRQWAWAMFPASIEYTPVPPDQDIPGYIGFLDLGFSFVKFWTTDEEPYIAHGE